MIRILHAADLHLDSPMQTLPAEKAAQRRRELLALPDKLRSLAESEGAQLLLLSGDVTDTPKPSREAAEALFRALRAVEIPVFIAPGNHDYYRKGGLWDYIGQLPNVHVFTEPRLSCEELEDYGLRVWGAGYRDSLCPGLLEGFNCADGGDWLDILCLHAHVTRSPSPYCPVTEEELGMSGLAYAALGHVHSFSGEHTVGSCTYAWPGCTAGTGFDECGDKGVIVADIGERRRSVRFVPLGERRFLNVAADASQDPFSAVLSALPEGAERDICRVTFTGERETPLDMDALRALLAPRFFHLELRDETVRRRDLWEGCGDGSLRGIFLQNMREKLSAAESEEERQTILLAVRCAVAALEGGEEPC